ncbi:glucose-1-phosphate adenylyltransferase [Clostridium tetanomorphum]|uniref:Glucose-1-phosphate adenylyltransferase subunit GlgD n=1 Tax=Clostridium tetanomorphum TaxID=1553 RepID=A0A923E9S4_CLOTT|nr:glucose-1-phosphate adenylyltransferase subunit GlgD [Clostridium tetanomorphum]MBC2397351.1 glucose-1-phosphate adenylyltransferase subunit GlgD [Clostridium tetanomorphum]MBP1862571.1 glucose-1-phosphate adenylyltransferase [Clostridium tetanomorphum]NRS85588.1 glucose-1-phosphate adenylyltransferase [Clostridium tetanomorphum]NRZ96401.1 glucose-1-phosphate adenylyltransferase [Clostridium tetanomorphum]SQC02688.1 glucose-1-phosphate adenylyltransferase, GlgD subunit [Clostridium tetanomo
MLKEYMGVLSLYEEESNIRPLTLGRPLASIPIGGRYRIIDFILSNMVNSGITNVGVFGKTKSRSLLDHLGSGKPWDLDRKINGLFIFNFGHMASCDGNLECLINNMEYFSRSKQKYVIMASSSMICNINFKEAAKCHEESQKDITLIYKSVHDGKNNFLGCHTINIGENNKVLSIGKNIGKEDKINVFMEMFIMKKEFLIKLITKCLQTGCEKSIKDYIENNIKLLNTNVYKFNGYLNCVNSINSYFKANMNMLNENIRKELFYENGLIYTKVKDEPPTKYGECSSIHNSLIANGCLINGTVKNSIIGRRVKIGKGSVLENCIIMQGSKIEENVILKNVIIDKNNIIQKGKELKGDSEFPVVIEKSILG